MDSKLSLVYTIPYEDTEPTADEVDDSRRHQFFAYCHGHSRQEPLPVWVTELDIAAAATKKLIDPADVDAENVFETSTLWKDCWYRVTGDDQRRPITYDEAMKPVVWETAGLPVGGYVIAGYTWEPAFNTWWERSGVVAAAVTASRVGSVARRSASTGRMSAPAATRGPSPATR